MPSDPVYATIEDLFSRFAETDVTRYADETATLQLQGDGPDQLETAYNGGTVTGTTSEQQAAQEAAESIKEALRDAESEINSHLQGSYEVPVATQSSNVPRVLTRIAADIALYRLEEHDPRQATKDRYDRARSDLRRLSDGSMQLAVEADGDTRSGGGSRASATKGAATFDGGALDDWRQGGNTFPPQH